ncbi:MAG: ATP synthase F1 subunit gamma [Clostridia bacterium]|nr:ATP synthase F1 subunit gamma [Clostridia bacterium]
MGTSAKALKIRIKSVQSTEHITRAMQLVASSKLRRATERMERGREYFGIMQSVFVGISENGYSEESVYYAPKTCKKTYMIVIAGDRGLAGGYNNNVFNLAVSLSHDQEVTVLPIGKKSYDFFHKKGYTIDGEMREADEVTMEDCAQIGKKVTAAYVAGEYDKVVIVFTNFVNMLSQTPSHIRILPLRKPVKPESERSFTLYEPSPTEVLSAVVPEYLSGMLYSAISESIACEQAARRNAMDSATKNADEMIEKLSLQYNRARQGAITQEITEIIAGSEQ